MTEEERAAIEDGIYLYVRSLSDMGILEEVITLESQPWDDEVKAEVIAAFTAKAEAATHPFNVFRNRPNEMVHVYAAAFKMGNNKQQRAEWWKRNPVFQSAINSAKQAVGYASLAVTGAVTATVDIAKFTGQTVVFGIRVGHNSYRAIRGIVDQQYYDKHLRNVIRGQPIHIRLGYWVVRKTWKLWAFTIMSGIGLAKVGAVFGAIGLAKKFFI